MDFFCALDILGLSDPDSPLSAQINGGWDKALKRARGELDRSRNAFVLAGAGTALSNLFGRTPQARIPGSEQVVFDLAAKLMARARELGAKEP